GLLAPLVAAAQATGSVTGTVVTAGGTPVADAAVSVPAAGRATRTDARGWFRLDGLPAGSVALRAERIGYAPAARTLDLAPGAVASVRFTLSEQAVELAGVVVSATREVRLKSRTAASIGTVSGEEIREV